MEHSAKKPSLKVNFSWTLLGNIIYSVSQFGILIVLAKLGDPKVVGQYTLGLAICSPLFLFSSLKLRSIQATDRKDEYTFNEYYNLRVKTSILVLIIILIILLFANYENYLSWIVLIIAFSKFFEFQSDIVYGLMQKHENMQLMAKSLILRGFISFTLILITFYVFEDLL